jgi:hypothetical protein
MPISVFLNDRLIAQGAVAEVTTAMQGLAPVARSSDLLAFDDETGKQIDLDLRASDPAPARPRGRPSLGVEAREVTLLPRHWQWLAQQPGGASSTLRRLVEHASKAARSERDCRDAAYRFLTVMVGDSAGYEEAMRALFAGDRARFEAESVSWPASVRDHGLTMAWPSSEPAAGSENGA